MRSVRYEMECPSADVLFRAMREMPAPSYGDVTFQAHGIAPLAYDEASIGDLSSHMKACQKHSVLPGSYINLEFDEKKGLFVNTGGNGPTQIEYILPNMTTSGTIDSLLKPSLVHQIDVSIGSSKDPEGKHYNVFKERLLHRLQEQGYQPSEGSFELNNWEGPTSRSQLTAKFGFDALAQHDDTAKLTLDFGKDPTPERREALQAWFNSFCW